MFRVCIVGSGPGGMYVSKYLLKSLGEKVKIDIVDKLPVCYGLVRYGVAPDHQSVKSVSNDFDLVMQDDRVNFFGNVNVGSDISIAQMKNVYDGIVLAYGASADRLLGMDKENETSNIWGARDFVNWYNGHPEMVKKPPPLLDQEEAGIVGLGNVALDCARILTKDIDELAKTDISLKALEHLSQSKVKKVSIYARRGTAQAACTIKELRDLTKLKGVGCTLSDTEYNLGMTDASKEEVEKERAKTRMDKLFKSIVDGSKNKEMMDKIINFRFLTSPVDIFQDENKRIQGLTIAHNSLVGPSFNQSANKNDDPLEKVNCGLLIRSIGYKSEPIPEVPFDSKNFTVKHEHGRVDDQGLYASGWVKRGPIGIVGTNIIDARETVDTMLNDFQKRTPKQSQENLETLLPPNHQYVSWKGYQNIESEEFEQAKKHDQVRTKILDKQEMLTIASSQ